MKYVGGTKSKAQSALEYLVTYGWAILLIVVVVAILLKLGAFSTLTVRTPPGSCSVTRPYGPNTTQILSLRGVCNGAFPEYVATFGGPAANSFFDVMDNITLNSYNITVTGWGYMTSYSPDQRSNIVSIKGAQLCGVVLGSNGPLESPEAVFNTQTGGGLLTGTHNSVKLNQWYFYATTYNGYVEDLYLNGTLVASRGVTSSLDQCTGWEFIGSPSSTVGLPSSKNYYWHGDISNVQLYTTALSSADIQQLYVGGIGGAPIDLAHLKAWWPLNGDGVDYSGDGQSGGPINVTFTSVWTSGYAVP